MYQQWIEVLASSPLFRGIGPEALGIMLNCLKPRVKDCRQREIVAACGQRFQGIGIVASGKLALTRETFSGDRIMLDILEAGDIFGETAAFSDSQTWPVTVISQEDSTVLFLPPDRIVGSCSNICRSHSTLIMNTLNILSNRVMTLNRKIEHLSAKSLRGKISGYLLELYRQAGRASLTVPMKRHELADYLGMPRPSLSRELGRMQGDGLIEFSGRQIVIRNAAALEKCLE